MTKTGKCPPTRRWPWRRPRQRIKPCRERSTTENVPTNRSPGTTIRDLGLSSFLGSYWHSMRNGPQHEIQLRQSYLKVKSDGTDAKAARSEEVSFPPPPPSLSLSPSLSKAGPLRPLFFPRASARESSSSRQSARSLNGRRRPRPRRRRILRLPSLHSASAIWETSRGDYDSES